MLPNGLEFCWIFPTNAYSPILYIIDIINMVDDKQWWKTTEIDDHLFEINRWSYVREDNILQVTDARLEDAFKFKKWRCKQSWTLNFLFFLLISTYTYRIVLWNSKLKKSNTSPFFICLTYKRYSCQILFQSCLLLQLCHCSVTSNITSHKSHKYFW